MDEFAYENSRVLKPNGISIHYFPSKTALVEPHIKLPLAGTYYKSNFVFKVLKVIYGKQNLQSKIHYMRQYCFYRNDKKELKNIFRKHNLFFKNYAENSLFLSSNKYKIGNILVIL